MTQLTKWELCELTKALGQGERGTGSLLSWLEARLPFSPSPGDRNLWIYAGAEVGASGRNW